MTRICCTAPLAWVQWLICKTKKMIFRHNFKTNRIQGRICHIVLLLSAVFCLFVPSLTSCHGKAIVALYFGRIRTRLDVVHFRVFRLFLWLLTIELAACSKPPSRNNHRKAPYLRTQQLVRWGWELNLDHAIVITRSPKERRFNPLGHAAVGAGDAAVFPRKFFGSKIWENLGEIWVRVIKIWANLIRFGKIQNLASLKTLDLLWLCSCYVSETLSPVVTLFIQTDLLWKINFSLRKYCEKTFYSHEHRKVYDTRDMYCKSDPGNTNERVQLQYRTHFYTLSICFQEEAMASWIGF